MKCLIYPTALDEMALHFGFAAVSLGHSFVASISKSTYDLGKIFEIPLKRFVLYACMA